MRRIFRLLTIAGILTLGVASLQSQEAKLVRWVFGNGGMLSSRNSENASISGIFGQLAIESYQASTESENISVYQGFWVPIKKTESGVGPENPLPEVNFSNYPNPFNTTTTIRYELPGSSYVTIKVYDVVGNMVNVLVNEYQDAGHHDLLWNGKDMSGTDLSSGSYIYELSVRPAQMTGKPGFESFVLRNILVISR